MYDWGVMLCMIGVLCGVWLGCCVVYRCGVFWCIGCMECCGFTTIDHDEFVGSYEDHDCYTNIKWVGYVLALINNSVSVLIKARLTQNHTKT